MTSVIEKCLILLAGAEAKKPGAADAYTRERLHDLLDAVFSLGWIYVTSVCGRALRSIW